jgi:hypothetical protein
MELGQGVVALVITQWRRRAGGIRSRSSRGEGEGGEGRVNTIINNINRIRYDEHEHKREMDSN